jgi:co-chaperonin GroES (HSP10)
MKLKVCGSFVLLKLITIEEDAKIPEGLKNLDFEIKAGLDANAEFRAKSELTIGTVVAVGPYAWMMEQYGYGTPGWKPWAKAGDKVMFSKYGGRIIKSPDTGEEYYLCNDDDIQMVIED